MLAMKRFIKKIKLFYDGYSWNGKNKVYNPFSTLKLFKENEFSKNWFIVDGIMFVIFEI